MLKILYRILFISFFIMASPLIGKAVAVDLEDLDMRVSIHDDLIEEHDEKFRNLMEIGGYIDGGFMYSNMAGMSDGFRIHHLSLQFKKRLNGNWSFFSDVVFEDAANFKAKSGALVMGDGMIMIETLYFDVAVKGELLNLRLGRYLTPAGIWNVDHYSPAVATMQRPQHIREIFPFSLDGIQGYGSTDFDLLQIDYKLYVGNGSKEAGSGDSNQEKAVGGRVTLQHQAIPDLILGLSAYTDTDKTNTDIDSYGFDLKYRLKGIEFQGEYARGDFDPLAGASFERTGWYAQFVYDWNKFSYVYRYDLYEASSITPSETTINTVGVNYHFTPKIVAKLENHWVEPEVMADYYKTILSVAAFIF